MNKFNLVLCEIHMPAIHGKSINSYPNIETHFLLIDKFHPTGRLLDEYNEYIEEDTDTESDSFASELDYDDIVLLDGEEPHENGDNHNNADDDDEEDEEEEGTDLTEIQRLYSNNYQASPHFHHPTIRNYYNIIHRENYIKPEIGLCIMLTTGEQIVIIKTFWLKIIQRKWKKVVAERKRIIQEMSAPTALYNRSITNKRQQPTLPGLKGLFAKA